MREADRICALCCGPFTISKKGTDWSHVFRFLKLSALVTEDDTCQEEKGGNSGNGGLQACASCVARVTTAVELKEKVVGAEEKVRHGQMLILKMQRKVVKMMRELEGVVGGFKEAVEGMEEVLEESKGKVGRLDKVYGKGDQGDKLLKEAIQYREKIMTTLHELNEFRIHLEPGFVGVSKPRQPQTLKACRKRRGAESEPVSALQKRLKRKQARVQEQLVELGDEAEDVDPQSPVEFEPPQDDDPCHDEVPPVSPAENGCEGNSDEDEEDEYLPPKLATVRKRKIELKRRANRPCYVQGVDLKGMPPYKRSVVTKILNLRLKIKQLNKKETVDTTVFDSIDPLKTHPLTYDPDQDKIVMGGIELTVIEEEKRLQCGGCGLKMEFVLFRGVISHVLGAAHLDLLQCPCCPSKISTYDFFRLHVLGHAGKFACDICGNPRFKREDCLKAHKWTHMSQEEKDEALRNGEKGPNAGYYKLKREGGKLQCSICGKGGFLALCYLKKHEEIHSAHQYMCAHCGKSFHSESHFKVHVRYGCQVGPVERKRFQCVTCLKRFDTQSQLRTHKLTHGPVRSFKCDKCGKTFSTKSNLCSHEKRHDVDRRTKEPVPCGKGCGAFIKDKSNLKRHETNCKFAAVPKIT